jgi:hypothetical protein
MPVGMGSTNGDEFMFAVKGWCILGTSWSAHDVLLWLARSGVLISYRVRTKGSELGQLGGLDEDTYQA